MLWLEIAIASVLVDTICSMVNIALACFSKLQYYACTWARIKVPVKIDKEESIL